ncbi:hypothetical protein V1527DRAFT_510977 [Lipomyces starkeyi]
MSRSVTKSDLRTLVSGNTNPAVKKISFTVSTAGRYGVQVSIFWGDLCLVSLIRLEHLQPNLYNKVIPEFTKKIIATVFKLKVGFGLDKSTTEGLLVNRGRVYNLTCYYWKIQMHRLLYEYF